MFPVIPTHKYGSCLAIARASPVINKLRNKKWEADLQILDHCNRINQDLERMTSHSCFREGTEDFQTHLTPPSTNQENTVNSSKLETQSLFFQHRKDDRFQSEWSTIELVCTNRKKFFTRIIVKQVGILHSSKPNYVDYKVSPSLCLAFCSPGANFFAAYLPTLRENSFFRKQTSYKKTFSI